MHRSYFNWIIALAILSVLLVTTFMWQEKSSAAAAITAPAAITSRAISPYSHYLSAVGIVEPSSGNIVIGSPLNRIVDKVDVAVGSRVIAGQELFRLECRDLEADLLNRCIDYDNALARMHKLKALPRAEDVTIATAALESAQVERSRTHSEFQRVAGLQKSGALSDEEVSRRRYLDELSNAKVRQAEADLEKTKAGAWPPDIEIARLQVMQAKGLVERIQRDLERTVIRSPIDGTVLQVKIHEGEFPPSDPSRMPAMIIGNTDILYLRVEINQFDASFFEENAPAVAYLQGNGLLAFPLHFVRIEPYFVSKQNLTNDINEKIDTRVLQVLYSFQPADHAIFVGQQMDVFIERPTGKQ
jgi:multidrug resistance efflux pump